jgi:hypothetical protein
MRVTRVKYAGLIVVVTAVTGIAGSHAPERDCHDHADCRGHESRELKHLSIRKGMASSWR